MGCGRSCIGPQPIIKEKNEPRTPPNTPTSTSRPSSVDYSVFLATHKVTPVNVHPHHSGEYTTKKGNADTDETNMTKNSHPYKIGVVRATLYKGGPVPRNEDIRATVLPSKKCWKAYEHLSFTNYGNISIFHVKKQNGTSYLSRYTRTMSTSATERRKSRDEVSVDDVRLGRLRASGRMTPLVPQQPDGKAAEQGQSIVRVKEMGTWSRTRNAARTTSTSRSATDRLNPRDEVSDEDDRLRGVGDGLDTTPLLPPQQPDTPRDGAGNDCKGNGTSDTH